MLPSWFVFVAFFVGTCIGSFLNVVVYRLPRKESLSHPPSHCPYCNHRLGVLDLIPILSYLLLRGRCRYCKHKFSSKYFWVEFITGMMWASLWLTFAQNAENVKDYYNFFAYALFVSTLIPIFLIDLATFEIPDELNAILLIIGLVGAMAARDIYTHWSGFSYGEVSLVNSLIGSQAGVLMWSFVALFGRLLFRKDALGHGDIKLARGIGALLLLPGAFTAFAIAVFLGVITGIPLILLRSKIDTKTAAANQVTASSEDELDWKPESIGSLVLHILIYFFWIDVLLLALPKKMQFNFYLNLAKYLKDLPDNFDEQKAWKELNAPDIEDNFKPSFTTIPFGPSLVGGAFAVIFFSSTLSEWVDKYLHWVGIRL